MLQKMVFLGVPVPLPLRKNPQSSTLRLSFNRRPSNLEFITFYCNLDRFFCGPALLRKAPFFIKVHDADDYDKCDGFIKLI